jgi:membrane associated rhomboid family serine protease
VGVAGAISGVVLGALWNVIYNRKRQRELEESQSAIIGEAD